jgi:hypothetical protein
MRRTLRSSGIAALAACPLLLLGFGCGDDDETTPREDAGGDVDGGMAMPDVGPRDAGPRDAGEEPEDSGPADAGSATDGGTMLPLRFRTTGEANGMSDDGMVSAECTFFADIEMITPTEDGWSGMIVAGEVFRTVIDGDRRYEFSALIGGEAFLRIPQEGQVEWRFVGDQSAPEVKPFWRYLETLMGDAVGPNMYRGTWECAHLDLDEPGFVDTFLIVPGTWALDPF